MKIQDFCDMVKFEEIMNNWAKSTGLATVAVGADGKYISECYNFTEFCIDLTRGSEEGRRRSSSCPWRSPAGRTGTDSCRWSRMNTVFSLHFVDVVHQESAVVVREVLDAVLLDEEERVRRNRQSELLQNC